MSLAVNCAIFERLFAECSEVERLSEELLMEIGRLNKEQRRKVVAMKRNGCTPLCVAVEGGKMEIVTFLVSVCKADVQRKCVHCVHRYDITRTGIRRVAPLLGACIVDNIPMVQCLVHLGAYVNGGREDGLTPLHITCINKHWDAMLYLVKQGADIEIPTKFGDTCLMLVLDNLRVSEFLLQQGANINARDANGNTALHHAASKNLVPTLQLLFHYGANPMKRNNYGDDILRMATVNGADEAVTYLSHNVRYHQNREMETLEILGCVKQERVAAYYWKHALNKHIPLYDGVVTKGKQIEVVAGCPVSPYNDVTEFCTHLELQNLAENNFGVAIQSLLICERLLGPTHPTTMRLIKRTAIIFSTGEHREESFRMCQYHLRLNILTHGLLSEEVCTNVKDIISPLLEQLQRFGVLTLEITFEDIIRAIRNLSVKLSEIRPVPRNQRMQFNCLYNVLLHLVYIAFQIQNGPERQILKMAVKSTLELNLLNCRNDSLLHLAAATTCNVRIVNAFGDLLPSIYPCPDIADFLLECGHDTDIINRALVSPLHVAASLQNNAVVESLLKYDVHIDQRDSNGIRAHRLIQGIEDFKPVKRLTLQCLAAQTIVDHDVKYRDVVPARIADFISRH